MIRQCLFPYGLGKEWERDNPSGEDCVSLCYRGDMGLESLVLELVLNWETKIPKI